MMATRDAFHDESRKEFEYLPGSLIWDLLKFAHMIWDLLKPKETRPTARRTRRTSTKHALDSAAPGAGHPRSVSLKWFLPFVEVPVGDVKSHVYPDLTIWQERRSFVKRQKQVAFSSHRFAFSSSSSRG